jgi:hypothetical protein
MQVITMYECPYCKKIFKTPDKHNCKRHPDKKNCFSCKHFQCFDDDYQAPNYYDTGYRYINPVCGHSEHYEHEVEDIIDVMYHNKPRWSLNCPGWEGK